MIEASQIVVIQGFIWLQSQSKVIWKFRDDLRLGLRKPDLHSLLIANKQTIPKGESAVSDSG